MIWRAQSRRYCVWDSSWPLYKYTDQEVGLSHKRMKLFDGVVWSVNRRPPSLAKSSRFPLTFGLDCWFGNIRNNSQASYCKENVKMVVIIAIAGIAVLQIRPHWSAGCKWVRWGIVVWFERKSCWWALWSIPRWTAALPISPCLVRFLAESTRGCDSRAAEGHLFDSHVSANIQLTS